MTGVAVSLIATASQSGGGRGARLFDVAAGLFVTALAYGAARMAHHA